MNLRPYQRDSIDSLYHAWRNKDEQRHIIVAPTGAGKSLILSKIIQEIWEDWPGTRILVLQHVKELLIQNIQTLWEIWPTAPAGIYSAGVGRRDFEAPILFANIQSIAKHSHRLDPPPEIVIVDECHLIPRKDDTLYKKTLDTLTLMYPHLKVIGLSASPYRLNSGWLHKGEDAFFDDIVYTIEVQTLIDQGYLSPVTTKLGSVTIDTSEVHKRGGEFIEKELQQAAMKGDTTKLAIKDVVEKGRDRKKWLVFATGVDHAHQIAEEIRNYNITCEVITGSLNKQDRDGIIKEFRHGDTRCLVNVNVLTTGFNVPSIDLLVLLRPTQSPVLYVQSVGRGMRTSPGKKDCLVLDYADVVMTHGPIDAVTPKEKGSKDGDGVPPCKVCPECEGIVSSGFRYCPICGYEFPPPEINIKAHHHESPILKKDLMPTWVDVDRTDYFVHRKPGRNDSVRVEYTCGLAIYKEWIHPRPTNERGLFYFDQWCKTSGNTPYYNADDFVDHANAQAKKIEIKRNGKYWEVTRREW